MALSQELKDFVSNFNQQFEQPDVDLTIEPEKEFTKPRPRDLSVSLTEDFIENQLIAAGIDPLTATPQTFIDRRDDIAKAQQDRFDLIASTQVQDGEIKAPEEVPVIDVPEQALVDTTEQQQAQISPIRRPSEYLASVDSTLADLSSRGSISGLEDDPDTFGDVISFFIADTFGSDGDATLDDKLARRQFEKTLADNNIDTIAKFKAASEAGLIDSTKLVEDESQGTAIGRSVDVLQKSLGEGVAVFGDLIDSDFLRTSGRDFVNKQAKEIEEGNYQSKYKKPFIETISDDGAIAGLGWIWEKTQENLASGALALGGTALAVATAPISAPLAAVIGAGTLAGTTVASVGEVGSELKEKGVYDEDDAALTVGAGLAIAALDKVGAGKVIPKGQIIKGLFESGAIKQIGTKALAELGTEATQEATVIGTAALNGADYEQSEVLNRIVDAGVIGGTLGLGTSTVDVAVRGQTETDQQPIIEDEVIQDGDQEAIQEIDQETIPTGTEGVEQETGGEPSEIQAEPSSITGQGDTAREAGAQASEITEQGVEAELTPEGLAARNQALQSELNPSTRTALTLADPVNRIESTKQALISQIDSAINSDRADVDVDKLARQSSAITNNDFTSPDLSISQKERLLAAQDPTDYLSAIDNALQGDITSQEDAALGQLRNNVQIPETDTATRSSFSTLERIRQGIPPLPESSSIEKGIHRASRVLKDIGGVPRQIGDIVTKGKFAAAGDLAQFNIIANQLDKAIKNSQGGKLSRIFLRNPARRSDLPDLVDLALKRQNDKQGRDAFSQLQGDVRRLTELARKELDAHSQALVDSGAVDGDLAKAVGKNLGTYVLRHYKVYDPDQKWNFQTVARDRKDLFDAAIKEIRPKTENKTVDEARNVLREMLDPSKAEDFISGNTRAGRVDVRSFIKRKDLSPTIRAVMGEVVNPIANIVKTGGRSSSINADFNAQKAARNAGLDSGLFSTAPDPTQRHTTLLFEDPKNKGKVRKQFAGYGEVYTTPETAQFMEDQFLSTGKGHPLWNAIGTGLGSINSLIKFSQVILSPKSHATNGLGALAAEAINARVFSSNKEVRESLKKLKLAQLAKNPIGKDKIDKIYTSEKRNSLYASTPNTISQSRVSPTSRESIEGELRRGGVLDSSVYARDFEETVKKSLGKASKKVDGIAGVFSKVYQITDNLGKMNAYVHEIHKNMDAFPDMNMKDIIGLTIQDVRDTTQNYDLVPFVLKELSRRGIYVPTYVSYSAEIIRNTFNTAKKAAKEIKSENPVIRSAGLKRAAGFMMMISASAALSSLKGNVSDEQEDAVKKWLLPKWLERKDIRLSGLKGDKITYSDPSYTIPYTMFTNILDQAINNPNELDEGFFARTLYSLYATFGGGNVMFELMNEVKSNKKGNGDVVYNEQLAEDDPAYKAGKIAAHVWNTVRPGFVRDLDNHAKAKKGDVGYMGKVRSEDDFFLGLIGDRSNNMLMSRAFIDRNKRFIFDLNNSKTISAKDIKEGQDPRKFLNKIEGEERVIARLVKEYGEFIDDMQKFPTITTRLIREQSKGIPSEFKDVLIEKKIIKPKKRKR